MSDLITSYSRQHPEIEDNNEDEFDDYGYRNGTDERVNKHSEDSVKLRRTNSSNNPVLHRALSTVSANQSLVFNQRTTIAKNFRRSSVNDQIVTIDHAEADASFVFTDLNSVKEEIRTRIMDSLVDQPTMTALEETKRLNWWCTNKLQCPQLYPLLTSGDGNCLLHATSLAMWGFHDKSLVMRKALNETLITSKPNNSLYRRWRWSQSVQNKKYGLVFSEEEWDSEWKGLLKLSSAEPRTYQCKTSNSISNNDSNNLDDQNFNQKLSNPTTTTTSNVITSHTSSSITTAVTTQSTSVDKTSSSTTTNNIIKQYYESLEEMHVYVLANNIRRPIIVYSDTVLRDHSGEPVSPINFGGIYLPLEIPPEKCYQSPVFLAFDAAHFSALVPMNQNSKVKLTYRIPLIDIDTLDLLPLHFAVDPGPSFCWPIDEELSDNIIQQYDLQGERRMKLLEKYLSLCKEYTPLTTLFPSTSTPNSAVSSSISSTQHQINEESNNIDPSTTNVSEMNESLNSTTSTAPTVNKKPSKPLNSFGKILRRTFIDPFSQSKRAAAAAALRGDHHQTLGDSTQSQNALTFENENNHDDDYLNQLSSPLLNPRTNILTIIMVNFKPKQPRACDSMIKNYIETCVREYRAESTKVQRENMDVNDNTKQQVENNNNYNRSVTTTNDDSSLRISKKNILATNQPSSPPSTVVNDNQRYTDSYTKNKDSNVQQQPHVTVRSQQTRNYFNDSPDFNEKNINSNNPNAGRKLPKLPSQSGSLALANVNSLPKQQQTNINYKISERPNEQVADDDDESEEENNRFSSKNGSIKAHDHPHIADVSQRNSFDSSNRHYRPSAYSNGYSHSGSKLDATGSSYEHKNGNSQKSLQSPSTFTVNNVKRQHLLEKTQSIPSSYSVNSTSSPTRLTTTTTQIMRNNRCSNDNTGMTPSPPLVSKIIPKPRPSPQTSTWYE